MNIAIAPLARHASLLPTLVEWFEAEWPDYYGQGRAGAESDLLSYCNERALPLGVVAFADGRACGFAALKAEPFPTHPHLMPWAGAAYVRPGMRRKGIGRELFRALETQALRLGHSVIYCATATSVSLLRRCSWRLLAQVVHEGQAMEVYEKRLQTGGAVSLRVKP